MTAASVRIERLLASAATVSVTLLAIGCSRDLSARDADRIIAAHPQASGLAVSTEGISKTSESESITKTRVGDSTYNLKFRRYDKDWRWEFVETKGGGWIAADELLDQLQEKERGKRAEAWA
ncbi:MAG: hypothetical protein H0W18_02430, partial [Acidobacteria bacterium]|nr:hypothetical protein [Acidobacteriota bacterium]